MKIANLTTILAAILAAPGDAAKEKHHGMRSLQEGSSMSMMAAEDVATLNFLAPPSLPTSPSSKGSKMNNMKKKTWNQLYLGPDYLAPLILECFETGGIICSVPETVAAAYRDKDNLDRFPTTGSGDNQNRDFIVNHNQSGGHATWINFRKGQATSNPSGKLYKEGYPDSSNQKFFYMYCCSGPQFVEGGKGKSD